MFLSPWTLCPGRGSTATTLDGRISFLHGLENSHGRSGRAECCDNDAYLALRLFIDLRSRSVIMSGSVGRVIELVRQKISVGVFPDKIVSLFDRSVCAQRTGGEQEFRTQCLENFLPLHACGLRHGKEDAIPLYSGNHCQPDSGIAARCLDNNLSGMERSVALRRFDHRKGRPVLHRTRRVFRL